MRYFQFSALIVLALLGTGCSTPPKPQEPAPQPVTRPPLPGPVGGDRDAHGCLGAAGYTWCEKQNQCARPWMLPPVPNEGTTLKERFNWHCASQ